jgi:hypothetical protein
MLLVCAMQCNEMQCFNAQERMKIEAITNEFCPFQFKKDLMSDLIGSYTGDQLAPSVCLLTVCTT